MRVVRLVAHGLVILSILHLSALACVSMSEHDRVQKQLQQSETRLRQSEEDLRLSRSAQQNLRKHLDERGQNLEELNGQIKNLNDKRMEDAEAHRQLAARLEARELALASATRTQEEQQKLMAEYIQRLKGLINSGDLTVSLENGKLVVAMPSDILFASGSAAISSRGQDTIRELGKVFVSMQERRLQVEGHTDNVPIRGGRFQSNWHLGHARAMTVVDILLASGMSASRLSAASFGEYQPKAPNTDADSRQRNRRIEVVIVPDLNVISNEIKAAH